MASMQFLLTEALFCDNGILEAEWIRLFIQIEFNEVLFRKVT
jgi:hypothetical protein